MSQPENRQRDHLPTVLLVDDEPFILEEMGEALEEAGYSVRAASGYDDALDWLRRDPGIGVMVTDLKMPGRDGLQLLQAAREEFPGRLACLLISGHASGHVDVPDVTVLAKPFDLERLVELVSDCAGH